MEWQARTLLVSLILMIMSGCASTPAELRTPENLVLDTEVDLNYQRIHRKLSECYNEIYAGTQFTTRTGIQEQIYSDLGESELIQYLDSAFGRDLYMATDLKKLGPELTRVKVYIYNTARRSWSTNVSEFLKSRPLDCEAMQ